MNEIVNVNTQATYAPYQQQPPKAQLNRSGFFIKYELKEEIGVGSTSKCYRCSRKSDGQNFACKVIDKRQVEVKFTGLLDQFFVEINVRDYRFFYPDCYRNCYDTMTFFAQTTCSCLCSSSSIVGVEDAESPKYHTP